MTNALASPVAKTLAGAAHGRAAKCAQEGKKGPRGRGPGGQRTASEGRRTGLRPVRDGSRRLLLGEGALAAPSWSLDILAPASMTGEARRGGDRRSRLSADAAPHGLPLLSRLHCREPTGRNWRFRPGAEVRNRLAVSVDHLDLERTWWTEKRFETALNRTRPSFAERIYWSGLWGGATRGIRETPALFGGTHASRGISRFTS